MRSDIRLKKYKLYYDKIDDLYCNHFLTISKACEKVGISPSTYQKICKQLNLPSVAKELETKSNQNNIAQERNDNKTNNQITTKVLVNVVDKNAELLITKPDITELNDDVVNNITNTIDDTADASLITKDIADMTDTSLITKDIAVNESIEVNKIPHALQSLF